MPEIGGDLALTVLALGLSGVTVHAAAGDVERRARAIVREMALAEKLDYVGGVGDFYVRGIPRLGLPAR